MISINTTDIKSFQPFVSKLKIPSSHSHKGQNGKVLIIGGSTLFHSASLWAAEIASHFADMVHYASTEENIEVFLSLKKQFRNGIIVHQKDLLDYVAEDDAILIGPGMVRSSLSNPNYELRITNYEKILQVEDEGELTYRLTEHLLHKFPGKKFVLDAGALQMMDPMWLKSLQTPAIITPHQLEFQRLFGIDIHSFSLDEKSAIVKEKAAEFGCIILLKAVTDIVSDGHEVITIDGGNAGLTKGGTGDVLSGLTVSFYAQNEALDAAVLASTIEKMAADELFHSKGIWYNVSDLIETIPSILRKLIYN